MSSSKHSQQSVISVFQNINFQNAPQFVQCVPHYISLLVNLERYDSKIWSGMNARGELNKVFGAVISIIFESPLPKYSIQALHHELFDALFAVSDDKAKESCFVDYLPVLVIVSRT